MTNVDLNKYAKKLGINNYRGTFTKDLLPEKPRKSESGIVNLEDSSGSGTHWTCYYRRGPNCNFYFDSFGLKPPEEIKIYLGGHFITNHRQIQSPEEILCGQYSLYVLRQLFEGENFFQIINKLKAIK